MARKCTHPKGYDKKTGRCLVCRARKPGRPPKAKFPAPRPIASSMPTAPEAATTPAPALPAPIPPDAGRAERMARLLPAPVPAETAPEEIDPAEVDESEAEPEKAEIGYDWQWTAKKLVTGLDIASGIAIDKFTDRDPLDAGEEETEELIRVTADYGEKRVGKIEAPLWLVFLIALVFFVLSKYSGAPKKPAPIVTPKPKPDTTPSRVTPAVAGTADTSIPVDASGAVTPEIHPPSPPASVAIDGNVGGATVGY